jgi:C1A family cysteine protease
MEKKGYGCIRSPKDDRDLKIRFEDKDKQKFMSRLGFSEKEQVKSFNLTTIFNENETKAVASIDQGVLGSCTSNATAFLHFFSQVKNRIKEKSSRIFFPSRLFMYYNQRVLENTVEIDSGSTLRCAMRSLRKNGLCRETIWPYDIKLFKTIPSVIAYREAKSQRSITYMRLNLEKDYTSADKIKQMKNTILSGFPFAFGFYVYPSFESSYVSRTGIVSLPSQNETCIGGHAVAAVGFDDNFKESGKGYFIVKNSWGESWGDKGYFYMPYEYISNDSLSYLDDFWIIKSVKQATFVCNPSDMYPCVRL